MRGYHALAIPPVLLLIGCSVPHTVKIEPRQVERAAPAQPRVHIGVYYSPQFRDYVHEHELARPIRLLFPVGPASVKQIDSVAPQLFAKVDRVDGRPPFAERPGDIVGVVEPRIEHFVYDLDFLSSDPHRVSIAYRWIFYLMNGDPVASIVIAGFAETPKVFGTPVWTTAGEATEAAMFQAASRTIDEIPRHPDFITWLTQVQEKRQSLGNAP